MINLTLHTQCRRDPPTMMQAAEGSLRELNIYEPDPAIYSAVLSKVRRASLDCYIHQVSSCAAVNEVSLAKLHLA